MSPLERVGWVILMTIAILAAFFVVCVMLIVPWLFLPSWAAVSVNIVFLVCWIIGYAKIE